MVFFSLYENFQLIYLINMYGCDTMMIGGEPVEKSNEDGTSIWGISHHIGC